jgi:hypothetical protein
MQRAYQNILSQSSNFLKQDEIFLYHNRLTASSKDIDGNSYPIYELIRMILSKDSEASLYLHKSISKLPLVIYAST